MQARLFPQSLPPLSSLDYAGACLPALAVGGDYYDFLSLGPDRLGLVIGDVMGKGIAAALLGALVEEVRSFSPEEQQDDLTLIVARRRNAATRADA